MMHRTAAFAHARASGRWNGDKRETDRPACPAPPRCRPDIEIAAKLHHPHILPLYDSGEAAGLLYYVMPLVEGESLRDRLKREKQLPVEDALQITREVAEALGHAHARGIVHQDIKPENVLFQAGLRW